MANGDGTVGDQSKRDIDDQDEETKVPVAEGESKDRYREQGCAGT